MPARVAVLTASFPLRRALQVLLSLLAAAFVVAASHPGARAANGHTIVVPAEDGYGFGDCLEGTKACGRIVADAWCEANGMAVAIAYGRAEDVTGATAAITQVKAEPGAFIVTCQD